MIQSVFFIFVGSNQPNMYIKQLGITILACLVLIACQQKKIEPISVAGMTQGTYYAITYYDQEGRNFQTAIDSLLEAVDVSLSLWNDQSVLSRVNQGDTTVGLDPIFLSTFLISKEMSALTDGYFDFTIAPLVNAWGFHRQKKMELTQRQIDSIQDLVDYHKVRIERGKVVKDDPRMSFDFNAIAPGYTVDLMSQMFDSLNLQHFIIDIGGEITARNAKPDGEPWLVAIERPSHTKDEERSIDVVLELVNRSVATSGSYRNYFEKDGKRYSHAIDPKTGYPVEHNLLSVTVVADNAATADALATAFLVMGFEKAKKLLEDLPDVDAYFIFWKEDGSYEEIFTPDMYKLIKQ